MTLGFTDPESPLACDLEGPISEIKKLLEAARQAEIPVVFTTVAYHESDKLTAAAFIDKVPALLTAASVDTLIISGACASGSVRATAVDRLRYGVRAIVPHEAVGDRSPEDH